MTGDCMKGAVAGILLISAGWGNLAHAQTADASRQVTAPETAKAQRLASAVVQQPEARTPVTLPKPQITLIAEKGKQAVTGTIGVSFGTTTFDFVFAGPIGEDDDFASPLTLGGLANGASARFGFTSNNGIKHRLTRADIDAISDLCAELQMENDCDTTDMEPWDRARMLRLYMQKVPVYWGIHAKVNRAKFVYTLGDGLKDEAPVSYSDVAGTFSVGVLTPNLWFLAAHIEAQKFHKPGSSPTQLCVPFGMGGATSCRTTRVGAPTPESTAILTLEGRRVFIGRNVAVNPNFSMDLQENTKVFEVPVYFLREDLDEKKNPVPSLNGGLSIGWHSESGIVVRAFVGVSFSLIQLR